MTLPTNSAERKEAPVFSGFMAYFPDAIAEVARLSKASNDKHNPGELMLCHQLTVEIYPR